MNDRNCSALACRNVMLGGEFERNVEFSLLGAGAGQTRGMCAGRAQGGRRAVAGRAQGGRRAAAGRRARVRDVLLKCNK